MNRKALYPLMLVGLGAVLIIASTVWFMQATRPESTPTPTPTTLARRIPFPDVKRISLGDAKAALEIGNAVFVDMRGEPFYSAGHIPGALSMSLEELETRYKELNPSDWIITYCT